jgi:hypothetical protein
VRNSTILTGTISTPSVFDRGIKLLDTTPEKLKSILNFDAESENGLYPIVAMVRSVKQRFIFHFEGDRGTNRLDKVSSKRSGHRCQTIKEKCL